MSANIATGLAITNPLVKYRALVATKAIAADNGQLRLALHLQKLYDRLKDYEPEVEYSQRLDQISRAVRSSSPDQHRQNEQPPPPPSGWRNFWSAKEKRDSLALTRRLTSHESAMEMQSPKGLMLHGEVGTGKSMLIDLFADCLPNRKKRRWHFNTFMLETFAKLEAFRRDRTVASMPGQQDDDYSLMWLAKDLIQTSPILFLDEFQMPDRVASKILTNLMTSFFHLGGVLVATSNRMPEELAKASGIEFQPPPFRMEALGWQFGFRRQRSIYAGRNEFAAFLEVLRARCEVWEMGSSKDYRRVESGSVAPVRKVDELGEEWQLDEQDDLVAMSAKEEEEVQDEAEAASMVELPKHYQLSSASEEDQSTALQSAIQQATGEDGNAPITYSPGTMKVYGRTIIIPRTFKGITAWTFEELCKTTLGPADYTTLASTYHTIILQDVPVLTSLMKNEARRFITLLDALYECRCKLFIIAAAGPDDLFFPDRKSEDEESDAIQSETFSEAYQDATAPFRPNILTDNPNYAEPDPEPNYAHARFAGLLNVDALEDDPPNKPHKKPFGRSFGRTDSEMERPPFDPDETRYNQSNVRRGPDFGRTTAFTGEDERFAYKRAQSRLWELCGARWWARSEEGWHRPLPAEVRKWERSVEDRLRTGMITVEEEVRGDVRIGGAMEDSTRDARSFRIPEKSSHSPFRTETEPPPKFSWVHAWGTMKWGKKAGKWGQGVDGLKEDDTEKEEQKR